MIKNCLCCSLIRYFLWLFFTFHLASCSGSSCHINDLDLAEAPALLKRLDKIKDKTFEGNSKVSGSSLTYKFQLCGNPSVSNPPCNNLANASVLELDGGSCTVIGNYNETRISGGADWVSVSYRGSPVTNMSVEDNTLFRDTVVTFICEPNSKQETFTLAHVSHCMNIRLHYNFIVTSSSVCVANGLSGGSVFCILVFSFAGAYLIFGFLYRRLIIKAKGFEQIPNYESWKELGNLVADGCDHLCRCNNRQSNKMYQGIDDSFSHPNDSTAEGGDDHLLPM